MDFAIFAIGAFICLVIGFFLHRGKQYEMSAFAVFWAGYNFAVLLLKVT